MQTDSPPPDVRRLLVTRQLWTEISQTCLDDGLEIGGKALGRLYTDGSAVACLHVGPGPRARRERATFRPDLDFQQACHDGLVRRYPRTRLTLDYHLHPDGPAGLSGTDHHAIREMLEPGGWGLSSLVFMVLTRARGQLRPHAFYARRAPGPAGIEVYPVPVEHIPDDDPRVTELLACSPSRLQVILPRETVDELTRRLRADPARGLNLYGYQRLDEALVQALATSSVLDSYPIGRAFLEGQAPPPAERELRLSLHPDGTIAAHFCFGGQDLPCDLDHPALLTDIPSRNKGLIDASLQDRHVVFIGLGSVGAPIALALSQAGAGRFTLLDPDRFSAANIARHVGDVRDLGRRKDTLLRERLLARNPRAKVTCLELDVRDPRHATRLEAQLADADLLVVSTDDPAANLAANRLALALSLPALFVGVFDGGLGGELFVLRPSAPGCFNCVAGFRASLPPLPRPERAHDYLNLRPGADLPPMNALGIDIAHTVSIAESLTLGLLGQADRLEGLIDDATPLLFVANGRPDWIFSRPFEVIPARLDQPGCPVCQDGAAILPAGIDAAGPPSFESFTTAMPAGRLQPAASACLLAPLRLGEEDIPPRAGAPAYAEAGEEETEDEDPPEALHDEDLEADVAGDRTAPDGEREGEEHMEAMGDPEEGSEDPTRDQALQTATPDDGLDDVLITPWPAVAHGEPAACDASPAGKALLPRRALRRLADWFGWNEPEGCSEEATADSRDEPAALEEPSLLFRG